MNTINIKNEVFDPILYHNTVGQELYEVFSTNKYSFDILSCLNSNIEEIKCITKLTQKNLKEITQKINNPLLYNYFINFQNDYKVSKENADKELKILKKIYSKIKHVECFLDENFKNGIDKLEDLSNFLEIEDEQNIFQEVNKNIALYKISNFEPDDFNLYAWLKKGEHDFKRKKLLQYDKESLLNWINNGEWKKHISDTKYFLNLPNILDEFGVSLIFTPYLKKTVFGCVRWFENRPLIQLSDKGKNLANFWYVLFHELGHVIKHENDEIFEGNDITISKAKMNKKEVEANTFANSYLFNGDGLRKFIFNNKNKAVNNNFVENTADRFDVNPIFVALWAQKAQLRNINFYRYITQLTFE